jgi:hypothetical protein
MGGALLAADSRKSNGKEQIKQVNRNTYHPNKQTNNK